MFEILIAVMSLHEGNIARYRTSPLQNDKTSMEEDLALMPQRYIYVYAQTRNTKLSRSMCCSRPCIACVLLALRRNVSQVSDARVMVLSKQGSAVLLW